MERRNILLLGCGGHAVSCIDVIEQTHAYNIFGLLGAKSEVGNTLLGYPIIGDDSLLCTDLAKKCPCALVSVGQINSHQIRARLYSQALDAGFLLPVVRSPNAYISPHAVIGEGTIVMHGAVIGARTTVGMNCILNSNSLVEHSATVGDHCHISTAASINGDVEVGDAVFIGSRAVIYHGVKISGESIIQAGSIVKTDV